MRKRGLILSSILLLTLGLMPWLTSSAAPLGQLPNPLVVVSNEGQAGPNVDKTLIQGTINDPHPDWRQRFFDPAGWQDAYPVMRAAAWTTGPQITPLLNEGADHIWGGTPGGPLQADNGNGTTYPRRYDSADYDNGFPIPASPSPQYLFLRKDFCLPINAQANTQRRLTSGDISITLLNATDSVAVPDGAASVWLNNDNTIGLVPGNESGSTVDINIPNPIFLYRGRNTLAMRVGDARSDDMAALLYRAAFGYAIDPAAIVANATPATPFEREGVQFNVTTDGLSGRSPYRYDWTFGDGDAASGNNVSHTYLASGTYTVTLTVADTESCTGTTTAQLTVLPHPLTIGKTAQPDPVIAGESLRYRITVQNQSPVRALSNVVVTDTLPAGAAFSFCTGGCTPPTPPDRTVVWTLGSLGASTSSVLDLYVTVALTASGTLTNTAYGVRSSEVTTAGLPVPVEVLPPPCLKSLTGVDVAGPTGGLVATTCTFSATIAPPDATEPVYYTWSPAPLTGQGTPNASYQWPTPGTYALTLRAENCGAAVTATHVITVSVPCPRPLIGVGIAGPTNGLTNTSYTFAGIVSPSDASEPITYTWSPAPLSGQGSSTAVYRWTALGLYTLTLRAENCGGPLTATHTIAIGPRQPTLVYLPLVLKSFPDDAPDVCPGWQLSIAGPLDEDFDHSGDTDWFTFQATAGVSYTVRTENLEIHADTVITVYDGTCTTPLSTNDDLPYPLNSRASQVAWRASTTGPLRILVRSFEPDAFGPDTGYSLVVYDEDHPAPPIQDVPDFCFAAHSIPIGQPYTEDFDYVNDNDWFVFDVTAGRTYTITTSNLAVRANTVLELWSGDCLTQLALNDDVSPPGLASQIAWTATEGGQLLLKVRHFDWTIYGPDTGYTVVVEEE